MSFKVSDFKIGDVVEIRTESYGKLKYVTNTLLNDGQGFLAIKDSNSFMGLGSVDMDTLTHDSDDSFDIMRVYRPIERKDIFSFDTSNMKIVFERKKEPKMVEITWQEAIQRWMDDKDFLMVTTTGTNYIQKGFNCLGYVTSPEGDEENGYGDWFNDAKFYEWGEE